MKPFEEQFTGWVDGKLTGAELAEFEKQLAEHPESGSPPQELKRSRYRQIVEPPCRVFYRYDGETVFVLHVMRSERLLRTGKLTARAKRPRV